MSDVRYRNYAWLYDQYIVKEIPAYKIAACCGVWGRTIKYWLDKHGITVRSRSEAKKTYRFTEEHRNNLSKARLNYMKKHGHPFDGLKLSLEHKRKISATRQGIIIEDWDKFISFEPYCPKFDIKLKEKIRNRDERKCCICGKSEILNGERLSVHHIDGDKMQGCDGKKFYLSALCRRCNARKDNDEKEFLIVANSQVYNVFSENRL